MLLASRGEALAPTQSEVEPNDAPASANPLPSGACFAIGSGANPLGDRDYWSFSGTAGATVWTHVDTGGPQNPPNSHSHLHLFRPNGAGEIEYDLGDGTGNGGDSTVESGLSSAIAGATLSATGTHFLLQEEANRNEVINLYRLFLAVSTTFSAEIEPNDTAAQATDITDCPDVRTGSLAPAADVDLYAVNVPAEETLFVDADGNPERDGDSTDMRLDLLAPDGSTILLSADSSTTGLPAPPAEAFSFNIATAGTYFVRVTQASTQGGGNTYRLMVAGGLPSSATGGDGKANCDGQEANQVGTSGADVLVGTGADETFAGLGGKDDIDGGGGNDTICAGPGKDTAQGGAGKDKVLGQGDRDTVKGGGGKDAVKGGPGKDRLAGQGGNDNLQGQGGSDRLNGGPGIDRCAQGAGSGPEVSCER